MPVDATPTPPLVPVDPPANTPLGTVAPGLAVVRPATPRYEGREVLGRTQAVAVSQAQTATVEIQLRSGQGQPLDLTLVAAALDTPVQGSSSGSSSSSSSSGSTLSRPGSETGVRVRLREALSWNAGSPPQEAVASLQDPALGIIRFELPELSVRVPGVLHAEAGIFLSGRLLATDTFFVLVERSQWGVEAPSGGAWSLREIKLSLRDSCPEDGYLNESMEYDLAEVCQAILRPVAYWNESQPPVRRRFSTTTFPFRERWLEAIQSHLYKMAAASYRREAVQVSSAGVALNDKAKAQEYEQKAQELWAGFATFVRTKKVQLNAEGVMGTIGLYRGPWSGRG